MYSHFILSLTQAITELFPVSSSAHLLRMAEKFFFSLSIAEEIALHLGSFFGLLLFFSKDIFHIIQTLVQKESKGLKIILATLPCIIAGYSLRHVTLPVFSLVGIAGGFLLFWVDKKCSKQTPLSLRGALSVGCFQCLSFLPGFSRLGACLIGCRFMGMPRTEAISFSFLLALPVIFGATILKAPEIKEIYQHNPDFLPLILQTTCLTLIFIKPAIFILKRFSFLWIALYRALFYALF